MTKSEYEETRTVHGFLGWIDSTNVSRSPSEIKRYRSRKGLWKKYASEAEPLARYLRTAALSADSQVKMGTKSSDPDAVITIGERRIYAEITTTDHEGEVHNRRQLNDYGFGPGATNNVRSGKALAVQEKLGNPRDSGFVMSQSTLVSEEIERVRSGIQKKLVKTYPKGTFLLVDSRDTSLSDLSKNEILERLEGVGGPGPFTDIFVCVYPETVIKFK